MKRFLSVRRWFPLILLVLGMTAMSGCFKPTGPAFSLYGHSGLIILPFENISPDQALGPEIQDGVSADLLKLNALPISEGGQVADYLDNLSIDNMNVQSNTSLRKKLSRQFKGDLLMAGTVEGYTESTFDRAPQRILVDFNSKTYKWGYYTVKQVVVTATIKLVDAASGNLVWLKKANGTGSQQLWNDLPYPGDHAEPPAEGWDAWQRHWNEKDRDHAHHGNWGQRDHGRDGDQGGDNGNANGKTVININIQNQNSQQQTQQQQQQQSQTNNAAPAQPALLYPSDSTFADLRQSAINNAASWLVDDFRGHYGWYPGYVAPSK